MKRSMMICVLSLIGMVACVQPQGAAPPPATELTERAPIDDDLAIDLSALEADDARVVETAQVCCSDYRCPTTGAEYSGCVGGTPSPIQAKAQCNAACSVACQFLGTYCD